MLWKMWIPKSVEVDTLEEEVEEDVLQSEFTSLLPSNMPFQEFVVLDEGCEITCDGVCVNDSEDEESTKEPDHPATPTSYKEAWNMTYSYLCMRDSDKASLPI